MKNINKFLFNSVLKFTLLFTLFSVLFFNIYFSLYPSFKTDFSAFTEMFNQLPENLKTSLSIDPNLLLSTSGFVAFCFTFTYVILAIYASYLGLCFSTQKKNMNLSEYYLSKPVSKLKINISSYIVYYSHCLLNCLLSIIIIYVSINMIDSINFNDFTPFLGYTLLFTFCIYNIAVIFGLIVKKIAYSFSTAVFLTVGLFVFNFIVANFESSNIKYLSVFHIFNPTLHLTNEITLLNSLFFTIIIFICTLLAIIYKSKREIL